MLGSERQYLAKNQISSLLYFINLNVSENQNKMEYKIDNIKKTEYNEVVNIWEASVRATHHFLKEEDFQYFKPLILNTYLATIELKCVRNEEGRIIGFLGVAD